MIRLDRLGLFVSIAALGLVLGQPLAAAPETSNQDEGATAGQAEGAESGDTQGASDANESAKDPRAASRERAEQRRAEAMAERERRYQELRQRAAEVGLELPETPPWEQEMPQPPQFPAMTRRPPMASRDWQEQREERYSAIRERAAEMGIDMPETPPWQASTEEERRAHREFIRNLTPEQRMELRGLRWDQLRERAAERDIELPETAPWEKAKERFTERKKQWESYRETVDAMTEEQREAAAAIFGCGPFSGQPGEDPMMSIPFGPGKGPMMPPFGGPGFDQGRPPFGPPMDRPEGPVAPYGSGY